MKFAETLRHEMCGDISASNVLIEYGKKSAERGNNGETHEIDPHRSAPSPTPNTTQHEYGHDHVITIEAEDKKNTTISSVPRATAKPPTDEEGEDYKATEQRYKQTRQG